MHIKNIMLSEIDMHKKGKYCGILLLWNRIDKFLETGSRLEAARAGKGGEKESY